MVVCSYCLEGDSAYRLGVEGPPGLLVMCACVRLCLFVCLCVCGQLVSSINVVVIP